MKNQFFQQKTAAIIIAILCLCLLLAYSLYGAISADAEPYKIKLKNIEEKIQNAVNNWEISETGKDWQTYRMRSAIDYERFKLKTIIKGANIFSGVQVSGTPLFLTLKMQAKGFCIVNIIINNRYIDSFNIEGATGTSREKEKNYMITGAVGAEDYEVIVEVINQGFEPARKEYWPPRQKKLTEEGIFFRLSSAEIAYPEALDQYNEVKDWFTSMKTADALLNPDFRRFTFTGKPYEIEDNRRTAKKRLKELNSILKKSVSAFDFDALIKGDWKKLKASIQQSYRAAEKLRLYAKEFKVYLIGNAHIDIAWLWRIYETVLVARNTYDTVILNMKEFPELRYAQSQALTYEWMEKESPELFEKIKKEFQSGKWEIVGGMWVEPDCNLISGESWVRQILYGKNYFKEKFGIDVKTGWNVDSFGYNWNMPQIYKKSGIDRFVTQKIWWNDTTVFPYYIFWWQGVDGTRLLSYFPPVGYTSRVRLSNVADNIGKYEATVGYKKSLILYGIGDHGGGPNREILNRVRQYQKLFIAPEFIHSKSRDFLENIKKDLGKNIPVWNDELYLEYHRGTYTTQARVKKGNRRSESGISTAEKLAAIACLTGYTYPQKDLEKAWKLILTNQFHDILPGSSITPVYRDALEFYEKAKRTISRVKRNSLKNIAGKINTTAIEKGTPLLVFNPLSWQRSDFVTFQYTARQDGDVKIIDNKGHEVPVEIEADPEKEVPNISFIAKDIPAVGYRVFSIVKGKYSGSQSPLKVEGKTLENKFYRIAISPRTGNIKSIFDKVQNREFIPEGKEANVLQVYEDRPERWDAWNIGYTGRMWELNRPDAIDIVKESPVRIVLRVKKSFLGLTKSRYSPTEFFPSSFFTQYITLYRDLDRLDIKTEADWWEEHMFLKAAFPVNVKSDTAAYEIPFAAINRTTKFDTLWEKARFEVPALKWADLSAPGYGISLLNDSKYGYDIHSSVMKISLLRSPVWPDPMADRGKHTFVYSLYTHAGKWHEAETVKRGYELNSPLVTLITNSHEGDLPLQYSFFNLEAVGVILDTIKKEERGSGYILRLYESKGRDERAVLHLFKTPLKIYETDLMENEIKEIKTRGKKITLDFKKYEIRTLKIRWN